FFRATSLGRALRRTHPRRYQLCSRLAVTRCSSASRLNRPGDNLTGVYQFKTALEAKRLELLHELIPQATTIAALVNPNYFAAETQRREVQQTARRLGLVSLTKRFLRHVSQVFRLRDFLGHTRC